MIFRKNLIILSLLNGSRIKRLVHLSMYKRVLDSFFHVNIPHKMTCMVWAEGIDFMQGRNISR